MPLSRGAALDYLQSRYGGSMREIELPASVGITAQRILDFDAERVSVTFMNLSPAVIYLAPLSSVSSTRGIRLSATGGFLGVTVEDDSVLPCVEWWAVAAGAASTLYILTVKRDVQIPA